MKKDQIASLLRDNINSLWADNDENLDDISYLQRIEAGVTKTIKIDNWKMIMYISWILWKMIYKKKL